MAEIVAEAAYTIPQAAAIKNVSPDYIRKAIHRTKPPFLHAKKVGKSYRINATALDEWWSTLEDA